MNKNRKSALTKLLIFILIIVFLILTSNAWLPIPGTFLAVKDNIKKADCIVPLGGDIYIRFKKTVELYNNGYSKNIVFSVLPRRDDGIPDYYNFLHRIYGQKEESPKEFALMAFKYFGKDSRNIYFTDNEVTSTYEEAIATRDFLIKKGFKSFILVTNTYHMRRALMLFKLVFNGSDIKIYHCAADNEIYKPHRWWLKEGDIKTVVNEYLSIIHNFVYHFLLKKKRTSFDTYY